MATRAAPECVLQSSWLGDLLLHLAYWKVCNYQSFRVALHDFTAQIVAHFLAAINSCLYALLGMCRPYFSDGRVEIFFGFVRRGFLYGCSLCFDGKCY